jgi:acyl dehydratase
VAIEYSRLKGFSVEIAHEYTVRDVLLYALGLGLGNDPERPDDLDFVYEDGLKVLPTFAGVMGYPGGWLRNSGIDTKKVLNGEQGVILHRPLPVKGRVVGRARVEEIVDKGREKGALIYTARDVVDAESGALYATITNTAFARGDGGCGGGGVVLRELPAEPDGPPEFAIDMPTLRQSALVYRLSGDYNPLHADPALARSVGFDRPILHGAATWGIAGYALMRALCSGNSVLFKRLDARFSSPVYPGETIRTEIWRTGAGRASFRCRVIERNVTVLRSGDFEYEAS